MSPGDHLALPDNTTYFYLAEGAANIVYKISAGAAAPPKGVVQGQMEVSQNSNVASIITPLPDPFENKLLRVRKDLPTTLPCAVSHAAWLRLIAPLFRPDQIVGQSLIKLQPAGLITRLNVELRHWELHPRPMKYSTLSLDRRPKSRQGVYLAQDNYGLLITDMTHGTRSGTSVIEFKPKWLVQSLSAPVNSKRCRQCAHVARVNAKRSRDGEPLLALWCPLDLVSESLADLRLVSSQLLSLNRSPIRVGHFTNWLETNTLLKQLRFYQKELDRKGVLEGDVDDENFLAAMTLRDCTVFVKLPLDGTSGEVEARLGDLDLKSREKREYWRRSEIELIDEGWYEGLESEEIRQLLVCQLSRGKAQNRSPQTQINNR